MNDETLYRASYEGTKNFSQMDVHHANATGFGAAADDYMERGIDLNEQLIRNKPATYFFRMNGDAMIGAGIQPGDILIVDKSLQAKNGKIIVAVVNGELMVRRFQQTFNRVSLTAENSRYGNIELGEFSEYRPWGVVTCIIHVLDSSLMCDVKTNTSSSKNNSRIRY